MSDCVRPGCTGNYGPHGACTKCGKRRPATPSAAPTAAPPPVSATPVTAAPVPRPTTVRPPGSTRRRTTTRPGQLVDLPVVPSRDPRSALLPDPHVRQTAPALAPGQVIDRYEIQGCIAHGGLGWIYLARHLNLSDGDAERWVVLKGLIDTADPDAIAAAENERRFLTEMDHQNIVKIHDFVRLPDPTTGADVGYLVMEYINGQSLYERFREVGPLPLPHVLAYGIELLSALGYLHDRDLLYCDLKPDNALHTGTELKLIDLGAVVRADRAGGAVYGTPGYWAPEIERRAHPTVASDIYTVGRTLAVLSFNFVGFTDTFREQLPERHAIPLLAKEESFYRLLRRATHPDPDQRFGSAGEMRGQLEGVLTEVLAAADRKPRRTTSRMFGVERHTFGTDAGTVGPGEATDDVDWSAVPSALATPLVDPGDPGAGYLQLAGTRLADGDVTGATAELDAYAEIDPVDWRLTWYRGVAAMASGDSGAARERFEAVYDALPGELPPKLALAAATEWDGDDRPAGELYGRVWRTDDQYVSAAFGLARVSGRRGDLADAVKVLDQVPGSSSQHVLAQVAAIRARLADDLAKEDLHDASDRLQRLRMDLEREARMSIEVLTAALLWVGGPDAVDRSGQVLGRDLDERALRFGLEKAYRDLATVTEDRETKTDLVRQANRVRPRTWF
ncbi:MAG TPA: tetratricopeptide repeat protein [Actinokineospora sp.]|nr:tetratricopeptide repeat protein [Actinokineospora sp.]